MSSSASKLSLRATRQSITRRLWRDENLPDDLVEMLWEREADRLLFSSEPLQVKDRCIAVRHDHASGPLLIKQHTWGGPWRTFRSVGREASAWRCCRLGLQLHAAGIPTPLPRACFEDRIGPWGTRSYLVTDYVEGTSLYRYVRFGSPNEDDLRYVARQVACIWQQLVESGCSHNDMKPENFIVDERLDVWLIDLEKARFGEDAKRHKKRVVFDVKNFLHVRGWHHRENVREMFYREFLSTPYGEWLQGAMGTDDVDPELSVIVVANAPEDVASIRRAVESVRDVADEAVVVASGRDGRIEVLDRIELCGGVSGAHARVLASHEIARRPWVLAVQQNEIVTPFLAKEMQQRIADAKDRQAFRITIEPHYFGNRCAPISGDEGRPLRLFRRDACQFSLDGDSISVVANPEQVGDLTGLIERNECATLREFIEQLNERSSEAALKRWHAGDRPALLRAMVRAARHAGRQAAGRGGIRSGWTGFQRTVLEGMFVWVEEAKLRQMQGEFVVSAQWSDADFDDDYAEAGVSLQFPTGGSAARKAA